MKVYPTIHMGQSKDLPIMSAVLNSAVSRDKVGTALVEHEPQARGPVPRTENTSDSDSDSDVCSDLPHSTETVAHSGYSKPASCETVSILHRPWHLVGWSLGPSRGPLVRDTTLRLARMSETSRFQSSVFGVLGTEANKNRSAGAAQNTCVIPWELRLALALSRNVELFILRTITAFSDVWEQATPVMSSGRSINRFSESMPGVLTADKWSAAIWNTSLPLPLQTEISPGLAGQKTTLLFDSDPTLDFVPTISPKHTITDLPGAYFLAQQIRLSTSEYCTFCDKRWGILTVNNKRRTEDVSVATDTAIIHCYLYQNSEHSEIRDGESQLETTNKGSIAVIVSTDIAIISEYCTLCDTRLEIPTLKKDEGRNAVCRNALLGKEII
ncbi:hypothetical protein J6590_020527 [Homalodisca vitripennis]|nr:hypothetical protein J6590_020527 [Homalodisca vitripennis]